MPRQTRECSFQELRDEYRFAAGQRLSEGETPILCMESWSLAGSSTQLLSSVLLKRQDYRDYHMAYILTPVQLIVVGWDCWPASFERTIRLADMLSMEDAQPSGVGFAVIVMGPDRKRITCRFAGNEAAHKFAAALANAHTTARSQAKIPAELILA